MEEVAVPREVMASDVVSFRGHPMVRSLHPTTIEVTTETHLTERGDCIIGVGASKGCADLDRRVRKGIQAGARLVLCIRTTGETFTVRCRGDPRLELSDAHDIVVRKSEFISGRTLALRASAAAKDVPRSIVRRLKDPDARGVLEIMVV